MFGGDKKYTRWIRGLSCRHKGRVEDSVVGVGKEWKDARIVQLPSNNSEETEIDSSITDNDTTYGEIISSTPLQQQSHHHHLKDLYLMIGPQERVFPNNGVAVDIDTELFTGKMLLMIRTPDVDNKQLSSEDNPIVAFFKGKQRRFEFQWQFKLKQVPKGEVCFCAELDEPIDMGIIQRALTTTALRFCKKMNPGFSYYLSDSYERPSYLSFPVGTSMDRFTSTQPGGQLDLPELGTDIVEDKESRLQRMKGKKIDWNVDDVYTMSFSSMYLDFIDWKLMNFPGLKPFSINTVAGIQPMKLTLYTHGMGHDEMAKRKSSAQTQRNIVFSMEVSNANKSVLGKDAKEWLDTREKAKQIPSLTKNQLRNSQEVLDESTHVESSCSKPTDQPNYDISNYLWSFFALNL
jgi:hypothetical protein